MIHADDSNYDEREFERDDSRGKKKRGYACRCFSPGEVSGTCPGPANCPMEDDGEDHEGEEE